MTARAMTYYALDRSPDTVAHLGHAQEPLI